LIKTSDGDLRRAITYLQSASRLHSATKEPITSYSIQEIGGVVPDLVMSELGKALGVKDRDDGDVEMSSGDTKPNSSSGSFEGVRKAVEKVAREGYSATQILSQVSSSLNSVSVRKH
jgi:replication factor C subunit 2/4